MDRLIYTDQKISGKKIKFKIGKKDFEFSLRLETILYWVKVFVVGAIMGIGSFMVLISTFGISYSGGPFSGGFTGGLVKVYNDIAAMLADKCGIFLDQLSGASEHCGLFLTVILLVLVAVSIMIVISGNKWLAFLYVIFAVIPIIGWDLGGSVRAYAVLTLGVGLFLAEGIHRKNNYGGMIYVLAVAVVAFAVINVPAISHIAAKTDGMAEYTAETQKSIAESYYGTNPLKDGYLLDDKRDKGKGIALQVQMSDPHSMYLRGFVGDILEEDRWVPNSNSVYYENRNLMYWLNDSGFNGLGQLQQSTDLANKGGKKKLNTSYVQQLGTVKVKNIKANSRYAYIPYEITKDGISGIDGGKIKNQNWGDSFITGGWRTKLEEYSYESAGNLTPEWTETAAKYYSNNATDPAQPSYEVCEGHYNSYVYSNYLYISPEDLAILNEKIGNKGIQKRGHVEYNSAVNNVRSILYGLLTYSEKIKYNKNKSAFANIMTKYQGYDVHYATAAVMLFRYYGIPARYVEGYYITPMDVMMGSDTVNVRQKMNHAWPEIYVDGIGFVPVEVCPNYLGQMEDADYTVGISNKTKDPTIDQSQQNTENPNGDTTSTRDIGQDKATSLILMVIGIIIGLILLAAIVLCAIILIKKLRKALARRKLFQKGDPKEATRAIYRRMDELELPLDEEAITIGNRASYSAHSIAEMERQTMLRKLKLFKEKKRNDKRAEKKNKPKKDSKVKKDNKPKKDSKVKKESKPKKKKDKSEGKKK